MGLISKFTDFRTGLGGGQCSHQLAHHTWKTFGPGRPSGLEDRRVWKTVALETRDRVLCTLPQDFSRRNCVFPPDHERARIEAGCGPVGSRRPPPRLTIGRRRRPPQLSSDGGMGTTPPPPLRCPIERRIWAQCVCGAEKRRAPHREMWGSFRSSLISQPVSVRGQCSHQLAHHPERPSGLKDLRA